MHSVLHPVTSTQRRQSYALCILVYYPCSETFACTPGRVLAQSPTPPSLTLSCRHSRILFSVLDQCSQNTPTLYTHRDPIDMGHILDADTQ